MDLPVLTRRRAVDEVYEILRRNVLSNHFKAGERLQIGDIAERLGVSLTPVRHAIQQLTAEGLIEVRPRSGTFVATLSVEEIAETFDLRRALECLAAETSAERITAEQIERLRWLVWALAEPVTTPEQRKRHEAHNSELHKILVEASGNRRLAETYESLKAHLQISRIHAARRGEPDWRQEQKEHEEIVAAAEARDRGRLIAALGSHIERAKRSLIGSLEETEHEQISGGRGLPDPGDNLSR